MQLLCTRGTLLESSLLLSYSRFTSLLFSSACVLHLGKWENKFQDNHLILQKQAHEFHGHVHASVAYVNMKCSNARIIVSQQCCSCQCRADPSTPTAGGESHPKEPHYLGGSVLRDSARLWRTQPSSGAKVSFKGRTC